MPMSYQRGPYVCAVYSPAEVAHLSPRAIRRILGTPCPGCGCFHPCDVCGNHHCGCPAGKVCVADPEPEGNTS
jgi:hypothetical protein